MIAVKTLGEKPSVKNKSARAYWGRGSEMARHLEGEWNFKRIIKEKAEMQGRALFSFDASLQLHYEEQGILCLASGVDLFAWSQYRYDFNEMGFYLRLAKIPYTIIYDITLMDTPVCLTGEAAHWCERDHYKGKYEFYQDGSFALTHDVRGPHKKYLSNTVYVKI